MEQSIIQLHNPVEIAQQFEKIHRTIFQLPEQNFTLFTPSEKEALLKIFIKDDNLVSC